MKLYIFLLFSFCFIQEVLAESSSFEPAHSVTTLKEQPQNEGMWLKGFGETMRIGGYLQIDSYIFPNPNEGLFEFLVRRARFYVTGEIEGLFGYMFQARWDRLKDPTLHYAYVDTLVPKYARVRVGLFKEPFGLEAEYSDLYLTFINRSLFTINYLQIEDVGVMLFGSLLDKSLEYGVGIFNGRGRHHENNQQKEYVGRLVWSPFHCQDSVLKKLYLGVSFSTGHQDETCLDNFITGVFTPFWKWKKHVEVHHARNRWGGDISWYHGPASVMTEWIHVDWGDLHHRSKTERFTGYGWYAEAAYVITGETKPRNALLIPTQPVDFRCHWGAWELAARYQMFHADKKVLDAGFAKGANAVEGFTLGVNWYLNRLMVFRFNWERLHFNKKIKIRSHFVHQQSAILLRLQAEF